jgi:glycolate oxidase
MPAGHLLTADAQLAGYEADGLGYKRFTPDAVAIPANAEELIALVRLLKNESVPYLVRGAGTSLSGGPVAAQRGIIIHLSRLRKIEAIDPEGMFAVVESGVVLDRLDAALKPLGLYYPPDPSSGPVCTLGGNVASNAGGVHCFRYGVTSNYVLGVEAVLLDGSVERFGGPAGGRGAWRDDWKRLFIGSEGTLGIFTRFWLRLVPRPGKVWTFRATYRGIQEVSTAIQRLAINPASPAAIELMDPRSVDLVESSSMALGLPRGSFMLLTEIDEIGRASCRERV